MENFVLFPDFSPLKNGKNKAVENSVETVGKLCLLCLSRDLLAHLVKLQLAHVVCLQLFLDGFI